MNLWSLLFVIVKCWHVLRFQINYIFFINTIYDCHLNLYSYLLSNSYDFNLLQFVKLCWDFLCIFVLVFLIYVYHVYVRRYCEQKWAISRHCYSRHLYSALVHLWLYFLLSLIILVHCWCFCYEIMVTAMVEWTVSYKANKLKCVMFSQIQSP